MKPQLGSFYEFGHFCVDIEDRTLARGGAPVPLTPKTFETLLMLIENSGRVMKKDDLMKRVWPDTFVEEANLAVNISALRKTLGERPEGGQYIETIPRRGYRFSAPVMEVLGRSAEMIVTEHTSGRHVIIHEESSEASCATDPIHHGLATYVSVPELPEGAALIAALEPVSPKPLLSVAIFKAATVKGKRRKLAWLLAATILAAAAAGYCLLPEPSKGTAAHPRRLAILPFKNLNRDPETDFLSFSLADAVITELLCVSSVVVRPSAAIDKYKNKDIDPKRVADELNVDTLLTGTYLKEGNTLRITAQLIDVKGDNTILWSQPSKEWKYEKLATIYDLVARQVVRGLQLSLTPADAERPDQDT